MSHFSLLVVTDRPSEEDVEKALIPFQEHTSTGECSKEYLRFYDIEDEYLKEWKTKTRQMFQSPKGEFFSPTDDQFRVPGTIGVGTDTHRMPRGWSEVQVPFTECFFSFEDFMRKWAGYEERDPETNRYGYWENPNAKWDWWEIGGCWENPLRCRTSIGESVPCNQCLVNELDLDAMRKASLKNREANWHKAKGYRDGLVHRGLPQERINADLQFMFGIRPGMSYEEYLAEDADFSTFAVLMDGQWFEKGKMGWWGIVSYEDGSVESEVPNEEKKAKWKSRFTDLLRDIDPSKYVTVVDCHI